MSLSKTPEVWCLLGDIEFDLASSPRSFQHSSKINLVEVKTRVPNLQFTGKDLDTLSIDFRWHVGWCDPDKRLQELWKTKDRAEPLRLVLGTNTYKGKWLIESVDSTLVSTTPTGETMAIEASVKLIQAGDRNEPKKRGGFATRNSDGLAAFARRV